MSTLMYLDDFGEYILVISIHTQMFHLRFFPQGVLKDNPKETLKEIQEKQMNLLMNQVCSTLIIMIFIMLKLGIIAESRYLMIVH